MVYDKAFCCAAKRIRWPQKINTANHQNQKARAERLFSAICSGFLLPGMCIFMQGISRVLSLALAPLDFILRAGC
ncbi:MAG: hypothetical protein WAU97_04725, partial [Gemmiger qucibialis]